MATGVGQRAEYRFLLRDGTICYIESQGSVIRDKDGKVTNVVVVSRDVTDRKRVERELIVAEAKFRALVEQAIVGNYIIQEWTLVYVNPRMAEILGETPEQIISRRFLHLIVEEDRPIAARRKGGGKLGGHELQRPISPEAEAAHLRGEHFMAQLHDQPMQRPGVERRRQRLADSLE